MIRRWQISERAHWKAIRMQDAAVMVMERAIPAVIMITVTPAEAIIPMASIIAVITTIPETGIIDLAGFKSYITF